MNYALKPGFTFAPGDLVPVDAKTVSMAAEQKPPKAEQRSAPEQAKLDLKAKPRRPWEDAHPKVTVPFNLRPKQELHAKLKWLAERMPSTSMQKIAMQGIEKEVDRLIAIYDTPDRD